MEDIRNRQHRIKPNKISELQWPHRHISAKLHDRINIFGGGNILGEGKAGFVQIWDQ